MQLSNFVGSSFEMAPALKTNIKVFKQYYFAFQRPSLQGVSDDLSELGCNIISYSEKTGNDA